ncbi:MAG: DEAD/DEAH box helicase family protein [Ardenticatenaceae bacterium]|nr:DEAD/DEAH box helicase family protein [Ardenticatenaceae bacterium]
MTPEQKARQQIDNLLRHAGWDVQDREAMNLFDPTKPGVAVREAYLKTGFADYLLFVEGKALGVIEAKKVGVPLSGVEAQSARYAVGLQAHMQAWRPEMPLPFRYESTGVETFFTNGLDPEPRARRVFAFHRPETLAAWVQEADTLRSRLRQMPPLLNDKLWGPQVKAITNLEQSLAGDKPRALIQMATGSGKTFTAVNFIYRLISQARARRVLFLVDRTNLGKQANNEFVQFETPDDGRKFAELYNLRHLTNNAIDLSGDVNRVYISTIQRLYAMLKDEELEEEVEGRSLFELWDDLQNRPGDLQNRLTPRTVSFSESKLPIEFFDFIVIDECHRSIYTVWKQVLEYFDAHLIGLTATPGKQTIGFFNQNLVMAYTHDEAVADGINVGGDVYRILTRISDAGSTVEAGRWVGKMDKLTREQWQEKLDEELTYTAQQLDRDVVSESQMRTIIRHFRQVLFTELFPERTDQIVPKTLIFAKDDNHAENIVRIVREEFDKGNDFCQKITYRASRNPEDILQDFRNSYHPRIAVTVDMIATGTDVRAIEILLFMRQVRSRGYFEQMRGRGTRVIQPDELQAVTADARHKTHFVLIDAVGLTEAEMIEPPRATEQKPTVPFDKLLEGIAYGQHDAETVASLAHRLARLQHRLTADDEQLIADYSGGRTLSDLIHPLIAALGDFENRPTTWAAIEPFRTNPNLRQTLLQIQQRSEIVLDTVSLDVIKEAGFDQSATDKLRQTVTDFQQFIADNKDEITALQILYNQPYGARALTRQQLQELAQALQRPPHLWTEEKLWAAYAALEKDKVRGTHTQRVLTDLIALVRHALQPEGELAPYPAQVQARYAAWLAAQEGTGKQFSPEQRWWLDKIAQHIGLNLQMTPQDFDLDGEMYGRGGRFGAIDALGADWRQLLAEMNRELIM